MIGEITAKYDLFGILIGVIAGLSFIDFYKSARYMLELPPIVLVFIMAGVLYYFGRNNVRVPVEIIVGFGIGLGIRGQVLQA